MSVISRENFENYLETRSKNEAREGGCGLLSKCEKDILTIYILDAEGNVIVEDSGHILNDHSGKTNEKTVREWVDWIFENGKENEYSIYTVREQEDHRTYYDPDEYAQYRAREVKDYEDRLKAEESAKKRQEERNARWREGCEWVRSQGKTRMMEKYVRRKTLVKYVVKFGIIDQWNEKYPEFKLNEYEIYEWTKYWEHMKQKGEDD